MIKNIRNRNQERKNTDILYKINGLDAEGIKNTLIELL